MSSVQIGKHTIRLRFPQDFCTITGVEQCCLRPKNLLNLCLCDFNKGKKRAASKENAGNSTRRFMEKRDQIKAARAAATAAMVAQVAAAAAAAAAAPEAAPEPATEANTGEESPNGEEDEVTAWQAPGRTRIRPQLRLRVCGTPCNVQARCEPIPRPRPVFSCL